MFFVCFSFSFLKEVWGEVGSNDQFGGSGWKESEKSICCEVPEHVLLEGVCWCKQMLPRRAILKRESAPIKEFLTIREEVKCNVKEKESYFLSLNSFWCLAV